MNRIRVALNKLPPGATIKLLRKVFSLPAPAARLILNDITKPLNSHKPWIHKVPWNGEWSGCWIGENVRNLDKETLKRRIHDSDIILFNVHGGGFRIGCSTMFMETWISWIKILKQSYGMEAMIMSIDYRLAPEYKYPSPVEDIVRAYENLTKTLQLDPEKIVVTGDSAGASLILEMLFITHDPSMFEIVTDDLLVDNTTTTTTTTTTVLNELPRPAGAVFSSPIVTDETNSVSWKQNVKYDYISLYTSKVIKRDYFRPLVVGGPAAGLLPPPADTTSSNQILGIHKLETGFRAFLPDKVLMFIGNKEVLRDDALDLARKAEKDGIEWENVIEDCVHDWFCVREVVKDKRILVKADATFADFCYRAVRHLRQKKKNDEDTRNQTLLYDYTSQFYTMRRSSEGLEIVLEEEEEDDDDEEAYDANYSSDNSSEEEDTDLESTIRTASFGKKHFSTTSTTITTDTTFTTKKTSTNKQKPKTIFV
ncbi:Alpha/Beta hydrolase protein [Pilaira anomala]|nr:Alpha/Beta hydrolase protein [Pilaira anomala]